MNLKEILEFDKTIEDLKKFPQDRRTTALLKSFEELQKYNIKYYNFSKSIESRCKVCNHEKRIEIEVMRVKGYSYKEIKKTFNLDFSIMSIQRHMKNHYRKNIFYYTNLINENKEDLDKVIDENNELLYLLKTENREELEQFIEVKGFCKDKNKLCELVDPLKCSNSKEILTDLINDYGVIKNYLSYTRDSDKENILRDLINDKIDCLICNNIL